MRRVDAVQEFVGCGLLQANDITRFVSNLIAEEIEAQAAFWEIEGDTYSLVNGLRRAAMVAGKYLEEENV